MAYNTMAKYIHTHTHTKSVPHCVSWHIKLKTVQYLCNMFQNIYQNEGDITTVLQRVDILVFFHNGDTQLPEWLHDSLPSSTQYESHFHENHKSFINHIIDFMSKNNSNHFCTDDLHLHLNFCYSLSKKLGTIYYLFVQ